MLLPICSVQHGFEGALGHSSSVLMVFDCAWLRLGSGILRVAKRRRNS